MSADAYPLQWPEGWPRARSRDSSRRFGGSAYGEITIERALRKLLDDLKLLGAKNIVVSSNVQLRRDGLPYSDQRRIVDPGAAVYFTLKTRQLVMATDRFDTVAGNLRSIGLAIEAMRQLERHGGGTMMERAFTGFLAITPPDWKKPWREVMSAPKEWRPSADELVARFRVLANQRHPDRGGSDTLMAELNLAYGEAKQEIGLNGEAA